MHTKAKERIHSPYKCTFELLPISNFSNFTTKGIYLVDKLRLCRPTHSWVTRLHTLENESGSRTTLLICVKQHKIFYGRSYSKKF
jgi:hypothetical protein